MSSETFCAPSIANVYADPELAAIAMLDAALVITRNSFEAHIPELDRSRWADERDLPEPEVFIADLMLYQIAQLRTMIDLVRRFNEARRARDGAWMLADDEIF